MKADRRIWRPVASVRLLTGRRRSGGTDVVLAAVAGASNAASSRLSPLGRLSVEARIDLACEPFHQRADLAVDVCDKRKSRFILEGRCPDSITIWRLRWGGNSTAADLRQYLAAMKTEGNGLLTDILRCIGTLDVD